MSLDRFFWIEAWEADRGRVGSALRVPLEAYEWLQAASCTPDLRRVLLGSRMVVALRGAGGGGEEISGSGGEG